MIIFFIGELDYGFENYYFSGMIDFCGGVIFWLIGYFGYMIVMIVGVYNVEVLIIGFDEF